MKKLYTFALVFAAALFTLSCEKEVEQATVPEEENEEMVRISIRGTLDKEISKTAYDADGKMTWVDGDQCGLIVCHNGDYSNQNRNTYTLSAYYGDITEEGRNASFYGMVPYHQDDTKEWLSTGIAVYPVGVTQINSGNYYNKPFIKMPSGVSGLASSIILVGLPDSDVLAEVTNFNFKTAMAVMKVTVNNIPAETATIKLCALDKENYPIDGDFTLVKSEGVATIGISNYQGYGEGYQGVDLSGEGFIDTRDFYFNIPVGTFAADKLAIKLERKDGTSILTKTIKKQLVFSRNECLVIPELNVTPILMDGNAIAPKLYYRKASTQCIRFDVSPVAMTPENYNSSSWKDGNKFSPGGGGTNGNYGIPAATFSSGSGLYYLNYFVLTSTDQPATVDAANVISYGSVPFYYLDPSTASINLKDDCTVTASSIETSEGSLDYLTDGLTNNYWHSVWSSGDHHFDSTYGVYIDINLNGSSLQTYQVVYIIRHNNNNGRPREIVYGLSNDGTEWTKGETVSIAAMDALKGATVNLPVVHAASSFKYLRIGITKAGDTSYSLTGGSGSTALTELKLYGVNK